MGRADRHVPRVRRRDRRRRAASRAPTATRTASATRRRLRARRRRRRREQQLARGTVVSAAAAARPRSTRRPTSTGNDAQLRFSGKQPARDRRLRLEVGAERQRHEHQLQAAGRVLLAQGERRPHLRRDGALGLASTANYASRQSGWYVAGRLPVHAALARRRALRPARPRHASTTARTASTSRNARSTRSATSVMLDYTPSEFSRFRCSSQQSKVAAGRHRQPDLPAIHPDPRRARRAQILERHDHETHLIASLLAALAACSRCRRSPRSTCSPPCPNGARWRRSWAATRSRSTPRPTRCRTRITSRRKPSLIARARNADLVVATGAELEIGWLPLVAAAGRQSEDPAGQARLFRGGAVRARCSRSRRGSIARKATSIPAAIRTSRPIRATSRASPGRSPRGSPSSTRANAAYYQARYKAFAAALERGHREMGAAGRAAQGRADRRAAQGLHVPRSSGSG